MTHEILKKGVWKTIFLVDMDIKMGCMLKLQGVLF